MCLCQSIFVFVASSSEDNSHSSTIPSISGLTFMALLTHSVFWFLELDHVIKAVMKVAPDQWYSIGLGLGYSDGQLNECTKEMANGYEKLRKIILQYAATTGRVRAAQQVLLVCEKLPKPVHGGVLEQLGLQEGISDKQGGR